MAELSLLFTFMIVYTYVGYFFIAFILGLVFRRGVIKKDIRPSVTVMIAAYNEEKDIAKKLENTLELDYPKDKLKIMVVSDASNDDTDQIVKSYEDRGVSLLRVEGRVGKTEARNQAMEQVCSEIVLFSDATTNYQGDLLKKMIRNFADPKVGMVTGHLRYVEPDGSQMGAGQKLFWKYESLLKRAQTLSGTLTGSVGCASAFRSSAYTPLPSNVIEDFTEPLMMIKKGYRVVFESEAICEELTTNKSEEEWSMRVRVIRGGLTGLMYAKQLLNPVNYPMVSFQLVSHKLLRWFAPVIAICLFITSWLEVAFYRESQLVFTIFSVQVAFYLLALCASTLEKNGVKIKILSFAHYFFVVNAAALSAVYYSFFSPLEPTWETKR